MDVRTALETFGVAEGIPVIMSDGVGGVFSGSFKDVPASDFLDRLATVHNLVWYYDGASLFVNMSSETTSILQDLKYMKASDVAKLLRDLGVEDERFPIKTAQDGELIMVSGPPRYVQLVAETIARADRLKESRTFNEIEVRLFPLVHTWADNTSFSVSTPESSVTIKGVAYLLDELMTSLSGDKIHEGTNAVEKSEMFREDLNNRVKPVIRPENRLNAVMVRDVATRMPMYEKLIRQLDVPQKLVEIGVTVVELSKRDALDWQLSLSADAARNRHSGAAGMNVDNLLTPEALIGGGVAGAYSYLGKHVNVNASLSALKQKGKTRNVSRTSLVTMNNLAAMLSDKRSFQARVVGEKVANLESVSAGTTLSVKPRIVEPPVGVTNVARQIWLSMELDDGGFDSISVDDMPMTSQTTLQTQAAVFEGDSLLLAGYFRDVKEDGGWGIPFLRDIPWIGWIFGGASHVTETVQRLFILTPHVVELGIPDDVSRRALRQRDLTDMDCLESDVEHEDDIHRLIKLDVDEHREVRHQELGEAYDRRKAELKRDRREWKLSHRETEDDLRFDEREWKADWKLRKAEYTREYLKRKAERRAAVEAIEATAHRAINAAPVKEVVSPLVETPATEAPAPAAGIEAPQENDKVEDGGTLGGEQRPVTGLRQWEAGFSRVREAYGEPSADEEPEGTEADE